MLDPTNMVLVFLVTKPLFLALAITLVVMRHRRAALEQRARRALATERQRRLLER